MANVYSFNSLHSRLSSRVKYFIKTLFSFAFPFFFSGVQNVSLHFFSVVTLADEEGILHHIQTKIVFSYFIHLSCITWVCVCVCVCGGVCGGVCACVRACMR